MGETTIKRSRAAGERRPILQSADDVFELVAKLGLFFFLIYWSIVLLRPFLSIALWSLILAVTLYPAFEWTARRLGGRRKLAAGVITAVSLPVFTGPIIWLGLSMVEGVASFFRRLSSGDITIPRPSEELKTWPFSVTAFTFLGPGLHECDACLQGGASLSPAFQEHGAQNGGKRRHRDTHVPGISDYRGRVVSGGSFLLEAVRTLSQRILPTRGQELLKLAGATIRNVSQGVIGIALLQAILAGLGFSSLEFREAACLPLRCLSLASCRSRGWWSFRSSSGFGPPCRRQQLWH